MTGTTHECPALGCEIRVPFERLACPAHWFSVPRPLRDALWHEYRENFGEESYWDARRECLKALGLDGAELAEANADA